MSLVTGRKRRTNASSKMAQLFNQKDDYEDDFYLTAFDIFKKILRRYFYIILKFLLQKISRFMKRPPKTVQIKKSSCILLNKRPI
ncbi:hypothetical protein BpHYR1_013699 [Brachionus plicatilis]|uniref:Uncharacterized protein n=1 Tax=Brachionus plicatilis TaxID=10195 RepID=A0A3M7R546_BRAPC|nr:hypothetical protein BpHYR1_013699 [Brachionus plicatilis]